MATFATIGLSQPAASTITMSLRTVTHDVGGSTLHSEMMMLGDPESTAGVVARVSTGIPSTHAGLITRSLVYQSSAAKNRASVYQSTLGDLRATVYQSTLGDLRANAYQSTATDLLMSVGAVQASTFVQNSSAYLAVRLSNGSSFLTVGGDYTDGSTTSTLAGPAITYSNSSNDTMRLVGVGQPLPVQVRTGTLTFESTTTFITSTHSSARYTLVSSAAGLKHKVFAYHIGSTHTNPSSAFFLSSGLGGNAGTERWASNFGSGSSGITGANLAVTPPAFLFATDASEPLVFKVEGGSSVTSTCHVRVSFSFFTEA